MPPVRPMIRFAPGPMRAGDNELAAPLGKPYLYFTVDMVLSHAIDSRNPETVCVHTRNVFGELGWSESGPILDRVFHDVTALFRGWHQDFQANDMWYHNFQHTLEAVSCALDIVAGRQRAGDGASFGRRDAEMMVMAALLHDVGFLKHNGDRFGTGAKYTFVHERRSCDFARHYLPTLGLAPEEVEDVCSAISCTGARNRIGAHTFRRPESRTIACILVTADYLAQMGAPDYVDKLSGLYREFEEGYVYEGTPVENRLYRSVRDLMQRTPDFWSGFVRPMLDTEAAAMHRYLHLTGLPNPYLQAVEANLAEISKRLAAGLVRD